MSKDRIGKYFLIRCKANNNLVLEVDDAVDKPGTAVVLADFKPDWEGNNDHQLWSLDTRNNIIRSKLNKFCLDVNDDRVVVNPYSSEGRNQSWVIDGDWIKNQHEIDFVIGLKGQQGCVTLKNDESLDQQWIVQYQPALFFHMKSRSDSKLVVDVKGDDRKPGAKIIVYADKGILADNQLWYEDQTGVIRSKLNDFAMDASGKCATLLPYSKDSLRQQWTVTENRIQNRLRPDEVLQMKPGSLLSSPYLGPAEITVTSPVTDPTMLWDIEFIAHQSVSLNHSGCGKHFVVRSRLNGLVLEVEGRDIDKGSNIGMAAKSKDPSQASRQLFYQDDVTGTIRSVLRNYALDATGGNVVINTYDPYKKLQQWKISGQKIQNRHDLNKVLEVSDGSKDGGAKVVTGTYNSEQKQHWEISHVPAKCFFIVSQMCDKVLDVRGDNASSGTTVILYERKPEISPNQLWYEDERGLLRSKLNGYVLDSSGNEIQLKPFDPASKEQQWMIIGDRIQNKFDSKMVIDISGETRWNGSTLVKYKFHGGENQRWKFDYVK